MARRPLTILLTCLSATAPAFSAPSLEDALARLEREWARTYYHLPTEKQAPIYKKLIARAEALRTQNLDRAEPLIWQAVLLCTYAGIIHSLDSLRMITKARELLEKAIKIDPNALEGAAFVTLGSLYYMVPGWPIAFGDNAKAREYLLTALDINPEGIDANYFFGDYLLTQGRNQEASAYFRKALKAPIRPDQVVADKGLQKQAEAALEIALGGGKPRQIESIFRSLISSIRPGATEGTWPW